MAITDPLVLPADIVLVPVEDLPASLREQLKSEEGDYVITRPRSRTPSRVVDTPTAELLKEFKTPKTIVEAVISYSQAKKTDPEQTLEDAFTVIQHFIHSRLLVLVDSEEASQIVSSFAVGEQIADFEVLGCIQVLEDTELYQVKRASGELAALKILRLGCSGEMLRMFDREIAILKRLDGRINPALLEAGMFEGRQYLAIEWCPGIDASIAVEELRRLPGAAGQMKVLHLCQAILEAYCHLHAQHVIHSDIHPRNVLVASDSSVKIIDFGLARLEGGESELDEPQRGGVGFFYEPEYAWASIAGMRPPKSSMLGEQYSVAALLYFLFTGTHYLDFSLEQQEMLRQIVEDNPLPFSKWGMIPWPNVEKLLAKSLSKNPADRFPSLPEFASRLSEVSFPEEQGGTAIASNTTYTDSKAAEELLNIVLQRVGFSGPLLPSGLTTAPTASVNYGAAGIAYALYRIASVQHDAALLSLADIWSTKAAHEIENSTAFYNDEIEITPKLVGKISPYHTASGIHCVQAFISHAMGDIASQSAAIESFILASRVPCENLDLTLGRSGTLLASSLLLDIVPDSSLLNSTPLLELGDEVMRSIWDEINALPPIQECSEITALGIAHGWAGLLYATMCWCQSAGKDLPNAVKERLQQLAECAERKGRGVHWPWNMQKQGRERPGNYMPGWCNGSAGYVHLWTFAHRIFGDETYLALAEKAAWNAWEDIDSIGNLCCSLAGQAYGLLNLYKHTGERDWFYRAQKLANLAASRIRAFSLHNTNPFTALDLRRDSLYKGEVGVAVLAAELSRPEASCMPFFEREGWPLVAVSSKSLE